VPRLGSDPKSYSLSTKIERARDAYWGCGSCPEQQALLEAYRDQLDAKDRRYLVKALAGYDAGAGGFATGISGPAKADLEMLDGTDGGIHAECYLEKGTGFIS